MRWLTYLTTPATVGDPDMDAIVAANYRWWHMGPFHFDGIYGVQWGPLSIFAYEWIDARWRVGVTWRCGYERIIFGGPLASSPSIVDTERTE